MTMKNNIKYFSNPQTLEDLKKQYRELAFRINESGTLLTTSQMQNKSSFVGWDFDTVWGIDPNINNGYPYLKTVNNETPTDPDKNTTISFAQSSYIFTVGETTAWGIMASSTFRNITEDDIVFSCSDPEAINDFYMTVDNSVFPFVNISYISLGFTPIKVGTFTITLLSKLDGKTTQATVVVKEKPEPKNPNNNVVPTNVERVLIWSKSHMSELNFLQADDNFQSTHYYIAHDTNYFLSLLEIFVSPLYNSYYKSIPDLYKYFTRELSVEEAEKILVALLIENDEFYEAYKNEDEKRKNDLINKAYMDGLKLYMDALTDVIIKSDKIYNAVFKDNKGTFKELLKGKGLKEIKNSILSSLPENEKSIMNNIFSAYEISDGIKKVFDKLDTLKEITEITKNVVEIINEAVKIESLKDANKVYIELLDYISQNCTYSVVAKAAESLSTKISDETKKNILNAIEQITLYAAGKISEATFKKAIEICSPEVKLIFKALDYGVLISNLLFHTSDLINLHDNLRSLFWINRSLASFSCKKMVDFLYSQTEENASDVIMAYKILWKGRVISENTLISTLDILNNKTGIEIANANKAVLNIIKYLLFEDNYEYSLYELRGIVYGDLDGDGDVGTYTIIIYKHNKSNIHKCIYKNKRRTGKKRNHHKRRTYRKY